MKQDIEKLLEKYYEAETTLEEEKILRQFFLNEEVPAHLKSHAAQFGYFSEVRNEESAIEFELPKEEKATILKRGKITPLIRWSLRIAAGVALLVVGFRSGILYRSRSEQKAFSQNLSGEEPANEQVYKMRKVLAFNEAGNTSASDRIQAVSHSYEVTQADQQITDLLVNVLNFDVNVNVRLAAFQALLRFENDPGVRQALIQSLSIQTDPNLQIQLIEALVSMKEKRAVEQIERIAKNQEVLEVVRSKAREGLQFLHQKGNSAS